MKILMAHNYYQQPGGEDKSFAADAGLLEKHGHTVFRYTKHNDVINDMSKVKVAQATIWNRDTYQELREIIRREKIELAHFQNTFPLISPAAYHAAQDENIPVVQSLRNYRLICPTATFFRDGHVCEDCMGKLVPYPGIVHACYRESRLQTAGVASMLTYHRLTGTWRNKVDVYITLTQFNRDKFIEAGLPEHKLIIKPNFLNNDPGTRENTSGDYMVFAGRMPPEKGTLTMLKAWLEVPHVPLKVVGDGPLLEEMQAFVKSHNLTNVELLGRLPNEETVSLVKGSRCLIFPSEWYEGFPVTIVEAFACGVPVITSKIGSMTEIVDDKVTGLHFKAGDTHNMAQKVKWAWDEPEKMSQMGVAARKEYEAKYTAEHNYQLLIGIYQRLLEARQKHLS